MRLFGAKAAKVKETQRVSPSSSDCMATKEPHPQVPEHESDLPTPDMTFSGDKIVPDSAFKIPSPISFDSEDENSEIIRVYDLFNNNILHNRKSLNKPE